MSIRFLQLAWRNLWRNYKRTIITMASIAFGYAMLMFVACLMAGLRWQMIENGTRLLLSQIQVHDKRYYPNRVIQKTIGGDSGTDVAALLSEITADPRVEEAAPRVYGYGMINAADRSYGVEFLGIDPARERKVTALHNQMITGSYLNAGMPKTIAMGDKLAGTIRVQVGSEVVLLTQAADGSMGNDLYTVGGIFHSGFDGMDRSLVLMQVAALQDLLHLAPARIHEVGVKLYDIAGAEEVAADLSVQLSKTLSVRVMPWPELAPDLADYVQFNRGVTFVLFFIFFLLAVIGIMNTMLMAVFERTREFGMLMALGMRPAQVVGLILAEAAGLASVSLILGGTIGAPLLWYLQVHGLDLGGKTGGVVTIAGVVVGRLWYGRQDFPAYTQAAIGLGIIALLSALYPAWRAAHFRPTEAIRKV
jgi:ABC-type lipoprotein release transport system permease subunit